MGLNYSAKILNNAQSSLFAQQAMIGVVASNIANVNTEGYVRRSAELETRGSGGALLADQIGDGVRAGAIRRTVDSFIEKSFWGAKGAKTAAEVERGFLSRAEKIFDLSGDVDTVGSSLTEFFTSWDDLALDPGSSERRENVLLSTDQLISSLQDTFTTLAGLQKEADDRLSSEIQSVNSLTSEIGSLNSSIRTKESLGNVAADDRDRRDLLLRELSGFMETNVTEQADGQVLVTLSNGFSIVSGDNARELTIETSPSFAATLPPDLSGESLSYITYDYGTSATPAHVNLTQLLSQGSGSISGLLAVRGVADPTHTSAFQAGGAIVEMATRVEAISRSLLTDFNTLYRGPDNDAGTAGFQPSAVDLDGNSPGVFGFFTYSGAADSNADGIATTADLVSSGIDNFTTRLSKTHTSIRQIAAGRDIDPATAGVQTAQGDARNITGVSSADTGIRGFGLEAQNFSVGLTTYTPTAIGEFYNQLTSYAGNAYRSVDSRYTVASANLLTTEARRDEITAVSLDEEFSNLILYQRAYQASARMLKVADELVQEVINLV